MTNEDALIGNLRGLLPRGSRTLIGSGDDCAQIAAPEGSFIVTTDVLVEGQHYRTDWSRPAQIGYRAAMQNLADIAAEGGRPSAVVVAATLSEQTGADWLEGVSRGMALALEGTGAGVVGGDISAGPVSSLAVTALGYCPHGPVARSGAQPGDLVAVAGTLGFSAAGYRLLSEGVALPNAFNRAELGVWFDPVDIFRSPRPPLELGVLAAASGVHAMMDVSDGLSTDAARLAAASNVSIDLDRNQLERFVNPLREAGRACAVDPWQWVLHGGEDHALLAAFSPRRQIPTGFNVIGIVSPAGHLPTGLEVAQQDPARTVGSVRFVGEPLVAGGWDHLNAGLAGR